MGKRAFFLLCHMASIIDKQMHSGIIDTYFKATNFEEGGPQSGNDDLALVRFEFLEIIIRIAKGKYIETGKAQNYSQALTTLLQNHIMPLKTTLPQSQNFRK